MKVINFLTVLEGHVEIKVYQDPIKEINPYSMLPVERFRGTTRTARNSNQNYLDFEVYKVDISVPGCIDIFCRADAKQAQSIIRAHKEGR